MMYVRFITWLIAVSVQWASAHDARPVLVELVMLEDSTQITWKLPPVITDQQFPKMTLIGQCKDIDSLILSYQGHAQLMCQDIEAITLEYPNANPGLSSLVRLFDAHSGDIEIFSAPSQSYIRLSNAASLLDTVKSYTHSGIEHILIGLDHLLLIICMVLIAGTRRRLILAVTGFTLGHSITLVMASLGVIAVPIGFVEWLIALSILVLVAEIARNTKQTLSFKHPIVIATAFGLLHGLGFASVLSSVGLSTAYQGWSLLSFNIGVEIGQLLFIALLLVGYTIVRRLVTDRQLNLLYKTLVYVIGATSGYWCIDRWLAL